MYTVKVNKETKAATQRKLTRYMMEGRLGDQFNLLGSSKRKYGKVTVSPDKVITPRVKKSTKDKV